VAGAADGAKRSRALRWYYPAAIRYGFLQGEVYSTADTVAGAVIRLPPGDTDVTTVRLIRVRFLAAPLSLACQPSGKDSVG